MKKYNGLNSIKIDLAAIGICPLDGRRFTDPLCIHATPEQVEYTRKLNAEWDAEMEAKKAYRNVTINFAQDFDSPSQSDAIESERIDRWLSDNWDFIPEIPFGVEVEC